MMHQNGLTKLAEACAALIVIKEKIGDFGSLGDHWDGKGNLKRLQEEMADVRAALDFVAFTHGVDADYLEDRRIEKYNLFQYWHNGGTETKIPPPIERIPGFPYCHARTGVQCDSGVPSSGGGFMGHTCRPDGYYADMQLRRNFILKEPSSQPTTPDTEPTQQGAN